MKRRRRMIKVLNLYAGIGGNRKLWPQDQIEVTAVEINPQIAKTYQDFFPKDKVIVADAHQYLLEHYKEFDFIWSSPPCPSHSRIRTTGVYAGELEAIYPDMSLYQEIILLSNFAPLNTKWVVENVISYYPPLIKPQVLDRHYIWCNSLLTHFKNLTNDNRVHNDIIGSEELFGFDISKTDLCDKRTILRNLVNPEVGLHIFKMAFKEVQTTLGVEK
jgi:DNA (cytosine-5)-methyltransferase 1